MPNRNALADLLMGKAYGPDSRSTADILALVPPPHPLVDPKGYLGDYMRRHGKEPPPSWAVPEPKREPNLLTRLLEMAPPEAMFAANFIAPNVRLPVPRVPNPRTFMEAVRGRDIPAGNNLALRWNPDQEWLDIMRGNQPVGRTFVTPVNAKTGYIDNPDAFILGPKVEDAFRRQGGGNATYDTLAALGEQHGMRLVPGLDLSRAAFNLWRKRDPSLLEAALSRDGAHTRLTPDDKAWLSARADDRDYLYRGARGHGQTGPSGERFLTNDQELAQWHASAHPEGRLHRYTISPEAKVADLTKQ